MYAMVVLKTGPKLTVSSGDPNGFPGFGFALGPGVLSLTLAATTPSTGWRTPCRAMSWTSPW